MEKNIDPEKLTVAKCLNATKYYIDFYQREYVWDKNTVDILLNDIFWNFENSYKLYKNSEIRREIISKFNWYYLNVFITNSINGKKYIVDGQQRLTTLTLIAIYLFKNIHDENIKAFLKDCISSTDIYEGEIYNIDNKKRKDIMDRIFTKDENICPESFRNKTEQTLWDRYNDITSFFSKRNFTDEKLRTFAFYFLERLVMVELSIDKDDTPMVFEVINDRGEPLKQFEILKGKLIGSLSKDDTEKYSDIWDASLSKLSKLEDEFFVDFLKGKFIFTANSKLLLQATLNSFHRLIFETDNQIANGLKFRNTDDDHIKNIKIFIEKELTYYTELYSKIRKNFYEFLDYNNNINGLSGQYSNIIAACDINDQFESQKIKKISREIDRMLMILRLNGIYNSNDFQEISYQLNEKLKLKNIDDYRQIFNEILESKIKEKLNKDTITSFLELDRFALRGYENMPTTTLRYFFARVDKFLCEKTGEKMVSSVQDISMKTGKVHGYHIEHIFSRNQENQSKFKNEDEFENMRNRIGGLLLLKGKNNISSGNEIYKDKLKTYSNGLKWGRTLLEDTYHANLDFERFNDEFFQKYKIKFKPIYDFDADALTYRTKLLYCISKEIWDF